MMLGALAFALLFAACQAGYYSSPYDYASPYSYGGKYGKYYDYKYYDKYYDYYDYYYGGYGHGYPYDYYGYGYGYPSKGGYYPKHSNSHRYRRSTDESTTYKPSVVHHPVHPATSQRVLVSGAKGPTTVHAVPYGVYKTNNFYSSLSGYGYPSTYASYAPTYTPITYSPPAPAYVPTPAPVHPQPEPAPAPEPAPEPTPVYPAPEPAPTPVYPAPEPTPAPVYPAPTPVTYTTPVHSGYGYAAPGHGYGTPLITIGGTGSYGPVKKAVATPFLYNPNAGYGH
eukprot:TRINITY_DN71_c0_g1_i2.p1 TRINITY_DN71_c0_g1~~TRINITY_DN71_c0_g1_i2.p1  ORF type:complete len:282 (-),score=22.14 TRINITY_DN71_c0_g1_i2:62-907(-)